MQHPTCDSCRHYRPPDTDSFWQGAKEKGKGRCMLIPLADDTSNWSDDGEDVLKPQYAKLTAFVQDASGYAASLRPAPNFYCSMHSDIFKENQDG